MTFSLSISHIHPNQTLAHSSTATRAVDDSFFSDLFQGKHLWFKDSHNITIRRRRRRSGSTQSDGPLFSTTNPIPTAFKDSFPSHDRHHQFGSFAPLQRSCILIFLLSKWNEIEIGKLAMGCGLLQLPSMSRGIWYVLKNIWLAK